MFETQYVTAVPKNFGVNDNPRILIAGRYGMLGKALEKQLRKQGYTNIFGDSSNNVNFLCQEQTMNYFNRIKPQVVFASAGRVGGIKVNSNNQFKFLYENMTISANIIYSSFLYNVEKLIYFGSSCMYPKNCPQPMSEDMLLTDKFEPTNEGYALAKILGNKLCEYLNSSYNLDFVTAIPCNLYGEHDNFSPISGHVIPALIRKFYYSKIKNIRKVKVWGSGLAKREFLYVNDAAKASILIMQKYNDSNPINIGSGTDLTIAALSDKIRDIVGYKGEIFYDWTKDAGMKQKLLNINKIEDLGWKPSISLDSGIKSAYNFFLKNHAGFIK